MRTVKELRQEWKECNKMKCFEIPYKVDEEIGYNLVWIEDEGNGLAGSGEFYNFIQWEDCFSLDEHLQELYEEVCNTMRENGLELYLED